MIMVTIRKDKIVDKAGMGDIYKPERRENKGE